MYCEALLCTIESANMIIASIYRPPEAPSKNYESMMSFLQNYLSKKCNDNNHYDVFLTGDFNLPTINWNSLTYSRTKGKDENAACECLLSFMAENCLSQQVHQPTRGTNILDLVLTNNEDLISRVDVSNTSLSDHNIVDIGLRFHPSHSCPPPPPPVFEPYSFRSVNLQKADLESINDELSAIDWDLLWQMCDNEKDPEQFPELYRLTVLQLCLLHSPVKKPSQPKKSVQARQRYITNRKRRKLNGRLKALKQVNPTSPNIRDIEDQLSLIQIELRDLYYSEQNDKEKRAVETLKSNPRYFFSYAKKFSKLRCNTGPLRDKNGHLQSDLKEMADILQDQYISVFSNTESNDKRLPDKIDFTARKIKTIPLS